MSDLPPGLAQAQAEFSAALAAPAQSLALPAGLRGGDVARTARRLALYRNNIRLARMNAVTGAYPVIRSIVGAEFFEGLAREYAIRHQSAGGDLNEYGAQFGAFLAGFAPAAALPYLPDVARLEWQAHRAYYAADGIAFDPSRLAALTEAQWGTLRFTLQPAVSVARYDWPVARIWEINQPGYTGEMAVDLQPAPSYALIHRPLYDVQVAALGAGDHAFIAALAAGRTLAQALIHADAHTGFDAAVALQRTLRRGLVGDFYFEESDK